MNPATVIAILELIFKIAEAVERLLSYVSNLRNSGAHGTIRQAEPGKELVGTLKELISSLLGLDLIPEKWRASLQQALSTLTNLEPMFDNFIDFAKNIADTLESIGLQLIGLQKDLAGGVAHDPEFREAAKSAANLAREAKARRPQLSPQPIPADCLIYEFIGGSRPADSTPTVIPQPIQNMVGPRDVPTKADPKTNTENEQ